MKKVKQWLASKRIQLAILIVSATFLQSCDNPFTIALHDPVAPAPGDQVTYTLEMSGGSAPKEVRLYEGVTNFQVITIHFWFFDFQYLQKISSPEVLLKTWTNPSLGTLSYPRSTQMPASSMITYRFEVTQQDNSITRHEVTYAGRDYPITDDAVPIYVTGNTTNTYDIVYIPDTDITNLANFRTNCRGAIRGAFFDERTTRWFRHSHNFYMNRQTGHATDYDRINTDGYHQVPSNNSHLSFAEGKVLMHQNNLRDYAWGNLFSTEMQNRGTILHEGGHSLFNLADEYDGGAHWQADVLPNNWNSKAGAEAAAPGRGKSTSDAKEIGTSGWFKICYDTCQMIGGGLVHRTYDSPCAQRVIYSYIDIATQ